MMGITACDMRADASCLFPEAHSVAYACVLLRRGVREWTMGILPSDMLVLYTEIHSTYTDTQ